MSNRPPGFPVEEYTCHNVYLPRELLPDIKSYQQYVGNRDSVRRTHISHAIAELVAVGLATVQRFRLQKDD